MQALGWWRAERVRAHVVDSNDGIIATAGVVEGFTGAGAGWQVVLAATVAAMVSGAVALAAARFGEVATERDAELALVEAERARLAAGPEEELAELTDLYVTKGLPDDLAAQVAVALSTHNALAAQLDAEYGITEVTAPAVPWRTAVSAFVAFVLGSSLPLLVVVLAPYRERAFATFAVVLVALSLTSLVAARLARTGVRRVLMRNLAIGSAAMVVSLVAGRLLPI